MTSSLIVIALGGNAIARRGDDGTIASQYRRAAEAMSSVAGVIAAGHRVVLTHGNGPVVGNIVLRGELAGKEVPQMPLYISDADSQGGVGLLLQQTLYNHLRRLGLERTVCSLVTQAVVDEHDPAFFRPSKPIGGHYSAEEAERLRHERGWAIAEQPDDTYRRVVASPHPIRVVETAAVEALVARGIVPIAAGGGGVPVVEREEGVLEGIDAVIDKDLTSAMLARQIRADRLIIAMESDGVYLGWGTPEQELVRHLSPPQAKAMLADGLFAEGSIAPKVEAASYFAEGTGGTAVICATSEIDEAVSGGAGTVISA